MPRNSTEASQLEEVKEVPTILVPEKKEKKKRVINPDTMTYLKAFAIYK